MKSTRVGNIFDLCDSQSTKNFYQEDKCLRGKHNDYTECFTEKSTEYQIQISSMQINDCTVSPGSFIKLNFYGEN